MKPSIGNNTGHDPVTGRFVKGNKSGGRKRLPDDLKEAFRASCNDSLCVLLAILHDENARDADRIKAAEIILDRGLGKPTQAVDITAEDDVCGVILMPPIKETE